MTVSSAMIPHSRPSLGGEDVQAVTAVLESGQLVQGPRVEQFERAVAAFVGVHGGVAVSSGTAALELALLALGVGPGDEVILPSYVCAAPWLAVVRIGARPRIVDIDLDTFAIDPVATQDALSPRTRAIIVPHPFGLAADLVKLQALGVPLIEDCAQTLGATVAGRQVGSVGQVAICSFYATKLLCTGEGGMLLSNDEAILEKARALREYDEEPSLHAGSFNHKMTDLQAALGLSQVGRFRSFLERRATIAVYYQEAFSRTGVLLPTVPEGRTHIYYRYVVRLRPLRDAQASIDALLARLERRGVQCRRPVFRPLHQYLGLDTCSQSEQAHRTAFSMPIYPAMTDEDIARTIQIVGEELS